MARKPLLYLLPVGTLFMGGSHILETFFPVTNFAKGLMDGFSVTLMVLGLAYMIFRKVRGLNSINS